MWCPDRDCDVISNVGVVVRIIRSMETNYALRDKKRFVVHLVPVGGRAGSVGRKSELGAADAVIWL